MAAQATAGAPSLSLHRLTVPDDPALPAILALSNTVFDSDPTSKHGSLAEWQARLARNGSFILYLAAADADADADAVTVPAQPVALAFMIPRVSNPPLQNGVTASTHIWIAGVLPAYRKAGCLSRMVAALDDVEHLTVCTYPARFPDMWAWLNRRGWVQECELDGGRVLLSRPG